MGGEEGYTLLELAVAMVLLGLLALFVLQVQATITAHMTGLADETTLQTEAQVAWQRIARLVRSAQAVRVPRQNCPTAGMGGTAAEILLPSGSLWLRQQGSSLVVAQGQAVTGLAGEVQEACFSVDSAGALVTRLTVRAGPARFTLVGLAAPHLGRVAP